MGCLLGPAIIFESPHGLVNEYVKLEEIKAGNPGDRWWFIPMPSVLLVMPSESNRYA